MAKKIYTVGKNVNDKCLKINFNKKRLGETKRNNMKSTSKMLELL